MAELNDVALAFKKKMLANSGEVATGHDTNDDDLDAQIAARIAAMANNDGADSRLPVAAAEPIAPLVSPAITSVIGSPIVAPIATKSAPPATEPSPKPAVTEPIPRRLHSPAHPPPIVQHGSWVIPPPATRALGGRRRITVEVPVAYEELRLIAKDAGMSCGHLVLSAMHHHGDTILRSAHDSLYVDAPPRGFTKKWQMMWNDAELAVFEQFIEELKPHLARSSRAFVTTVILDHCANDSQADDR